MRASTSLATGAPDSDPSACAVHHLAGQRRACAHLAHAVNAREAAHVAARVEVALGELPLGGAPVAHVYCLDCAEEHKLPAVSQVPAEDEAGIPGFAELIPVCAGCLQDAEEAAQAQQRR